MLDKQNSPIFVTGVERSGSTLIARIISMCGAFTGETTEMWENKKVKVFLNWFYQSNGIDPRGQFPLPTIEEMMIPNKWGHRINDLLREDGYTKDKYWMYKSSRLCQTFPLWNYAYPNAKWIIVRRRTGDIVHSCLRTGFMTAFVSEENRSKIGVETEQDGWLWWIHEHEKLFVQMIEQGLNCKIVWPERMVTADYEQMYEMIEWLGLKWNDNIPSVIAPLLKLKQ